MRFLSQASNNAVNCVQQVNTYKIITDEKYSDIDFVAEKKGQWQEQIVQEEGSQ